MLKKIVLGCGAALVIATAAFAAFLFSPPGRRLTDGVRRVLETDELNGGSLETAEDVLRYLEAHPERYALAAWDVGAEDQGLFHDADTPWPLASTVKIIPLALASEELAAGRWSPDTPVPELEAFYLPGTDGDAHPEAKAAGDTTTLGGAIHAMIRFSDNAATDCILFRLGRERLTSTEPGLPTPHPLSGTTLLASSAWMNDGGADDAAWASAAALLDGGTKPELGKPIAAQEQMARELDNRGTARAFAKLMERLFTDETPRYALARRELSWPMEFKGNQRDFEVLATKGGSLPGVLTSATWATTKNGQRRVVALFLHDLPFSTWLGLSKSYAQQALERELLFSPDALQRLRPRLTKR